MSDTCSLSEKGRNSKRRNSKRKRSRKSSSPVPQDTLSSSNFLPSFSREDILPVPSRILDPIRQQEVDHLSDSFLEESRPDSQPRPGSHPRPDSRSPSIGMKSPSQEVIASNSGYSIIQITSDKEDSYLDESTKPEVTGLQTTPPSHKGFENLLSKEEPILGPDQAMREQCSEVEKGKQRNIMHE